MDPASFAAAVRVVERPHRTAALAAWVQSLYDEDPPILVGGSAVELYTAGTYVTGDLDFVGRVPDGVRDRLERDGFEKRGRHWVHEAERIFLEFPGTSLGPGEQPAEIELDRWVVRIVSPEDALVDRLAAWKHWRSSIDGVSAFLIWAQQRETLDFERLRDRARAEHVVDALRRVEALSDEVGERSPTADELRGWAEWPR